LQEEQHQTQSVKPRDRAVSNPRLRMLELFRPWVTWKSFTPLVLLTAIADGKELSRADSADETGAGRLLRRTRRYCDQSGEIGAELAQIAAGTPPGRVSC